MSYQGTRVIRGRRIARDDKVNCEKWLEHKMRERKGPAIV